MSQKPIREAQGESDFLGGTGLLDSRVGGQSND